MKKLIASLALALTALTLNTVQADTQTQQRPTTPRQKIAQGVTTPANGATNAAQQANQSGQQAIKNAQNATNNGVPPTQPTTTTPTTPATPSEPGSLPTPKTDGSSFLITQRAPMQNPNTATATKPTETITISEVTTTDPAFATLAQALQASGLTNTLKGTGPYTFFAPNDKAFAKLSPNALHDLLRPENKDKLASILSSHVVAGKISSGNLKTSKLKTINGQTLDVKVTDQGITVNNAKVEKVAIPTANGTIYIIDTVLQQ